MSELVASYATDRTLLRLIRPTGELMSFLLVKENDDQTDFIPQADLKLYERAVDSARAEEEIYWQALYARAEQQDKPLIVNRWEHFRSYAGLPALDIQKETGDNHHPPHSGRSSSGTEGQAEPERD